jgi:hypothetical protein
MGKDWSKHHHCRYTVSTYQSRKWQVQLSLQEAQLSLQEEVQLSLQEEVQLSLQEVQLSLQEVQL